MIHSLKILNGDGDYFLIECRVSDRMLTQEEEEEWKEEYREESKFYDSPTEIVVIQNDLSVEAMDEVDYMNGVFPLYEEDEWLES